jgi:hypothetical protein
VGTNHTCIVNTKQRLGKQMLLGKNLVAANRALANHGLGKQLLPGKAYNTADSDRFSVGPTQGYIRKYIIGCHTSPCGGGVEYLHCDPASRRRWQNGKSQIWDSKIRSWVPRDSDPRKNALARASSIYKRQTRPLVREGAPQKQDCNCQTVINIWSWAPDGVRHQDLLTDWPSVAMWLWLWLDATQIPWKTGWT